MGPKTKEKKLKDSEGNSVIIKTTLFTGSYGIELITKILSKVAPTLLSSIDSKNKKLTEIDINFKEISDNLMEGLSDGSILELIKEILNGSKIDKYDLANEGSFDIAFTGEYGLLIDSITFVLEANYSSFLVANITKKLKKVFQTMKDNFGKLTQSLKE